MSIEILNMGRFSADEHAIDIALPVLAIECEASPPVEKYLDAYEEAVLNLLSLKLSANGIAHTLCATESLVGDILFRLQVKQYVAKETGQPWKLTEDGEKYLSGMVTERASSESQYGYMFINAIKKEILPFFYQGDVGKISLFRGGKLPLKLTVEGDEQRTFVPPKIRQFALRKAYQTFVRNLETVGECKEGAITEEEAHDRFADLESFDEIAEEEEISSADAQTGKQEKNKLIRVSGKPAKRFYLHMRMIMDPCYPGGYRAESPFDLRGMDNGYFLRQLQWLAQSESAYLGGERFQDFLGREICKLRPPGKGEKEDFRVFVMRNIPLLHRLRSRFPNVYEDMERIHDLMERQSGLLERENIVSALSRNVLERLFNAYFRQIGPDALELVRQRAIEDMATSTIKIERSDICVKAGLREDALEWVQPSYLRSILNKLPDKHGNSVLEKFINMLVVSYYGVGAQTISRFLGQPDIDGKYHALFELNRIRNKVSHDNTDDPFTDRDYDIYMGHIFGMVNQLLKPFGEE